MEKKCYNGKEYVKKITSSLTKKYVLEVLENGILVHSELRGIGGALISSSSKRFRLSHKSPTYDTLVDEIEAWFRLD